MRSRPASTTRAFHLRSRLPAHSIAGSRRSSILPSPPVWRPHEPGYDFSSARAGVAHLGERDLAQVEVAGSKPVSRSIFTLAALEFALAGDGATSDLSGADGAGCAPALYLSIAECALR